MKVSVVIPAHNEEKVIANTLRAILAQDYHDFEVIVVDNASGDETYKVASGFPVRVVKEPRKGLLWARERGRIEAHGDIIANVDADCVPDADWLSKGVKHFFEDRSGKISAVSGPYDYHDAKWFFRNTSLLTQKYIYRTVSIILQLPFVKNGAVMIGGNNMIRAEVLRKTGGYNTSLTFYGEDTDTAVRVANHGRVVFNPRFVMKTSARRFKNEGIVTIEAKYIYHFLKHIFAGKK